MVFFAQIAAGEPDRARCFLSDRFGGVSRPPYAELNLGDHVGDRAEDVEKNRSLLAQRLGLHRSQFVFMQQVHGAEVTVVDHIWTETSATDALVTSRRGLVLVVLSADCVPVVLASTEPALVAVAHSGRRGVVAGVVPATVRALVELGGDPERFSAVIGPAICGPCYEVSERLQGEVTDVVPAAHANTPTGGAALDVRAGVVAQLKAEGVTSIDVDPRCTRESEELYSYRRDGRTGRFAAAAWLPG